MIILTFKHPFKFGLNVIYIINLLISNVFAKVIISRDLQRPDRIVGGEPVNRGDLPWQVSLQAILKFSNYNHPFCGGTLIEKSWVLTAAHCLRAVSYKDMVAVVGAWDLKEKNTAYRVKAAYTHEYDSDHMKNDIALLKLDILNPYSRDENGNTGTPISIETEKEVARKESSCLISGWGRLKSKGELPTVLQATKINLQSDEECHSIMNDKASMKVTETNICAGGKAKDTCQGDSGGPLVCCTDASSPKASSCRVTGVTSWGIGCATPGYPGIYTEVAYYADWIKKTIEQEKD